MALVVGPTEPPTNRGLPGVLNSFAACLASSAARLFRKFASSASPYSASTIGAPPKLFVSTMSVAAASSPSRRQARGSSARVTHVTLWPIRSGYASPGRYFSLPFRRMKRPNCQRILAFPDTSILPRFPCGYLSSCIELVLFSLEQRIHRIERRIPECYTAFGRRKRTLHEPTPENPE